MFFFSSLVYRAYNISSSFANATPPCQRKHRIQKRSRFKNPKGKKVCSEGPYFTSGSVLPASRRTDYSPSRGLTQAEQQSRPGLPTAASSLTAAPRVQTTRGNSASRAGTRPRCRFPRGWCPQGPPPLPGTPSPGSHGPGP